MSGKWTKRAVALIVVALIAATVIYALWPKPVAVDIATIDSGPLSVTVDEEGVARIRDVFSVSAPIAGRLDRLPVHVGDRVYANSTEVASIRPATPSFLDIRTRRELEAAAEAARAAVDLAQAQLDGALATEKMAESDLDRALQLSKGGTISLRALEQATSAVDTAKAAAAQGRATLALRQSERDSAAARLIEPDQPVMTPQPAGCCLTVKAPVDGIVLKLVSESEQVVGAGTPLLEIGNPRETEIVVHLLSSDAAAIAPGTPATIDGWGGPALSATVRAIDPVAYTKVSALGIEEQRVDATLGIVEPYEERQALGHGFRVMAHILTWQGDAARVPLGALFRRGSAWAVYRVVDGRAAATTIEIGHRNNQYAEVLSGLAPGDVVVLHPSDAVSEGVGLTAREEGSS
jgi:HlyD family secretion protein